MIVNNFFAALPVLGIVVFYFKISLAHPSHSNSPHTVNDRVGNDNGGGDYVISQLNHQHPNSSQLTPIQTNSISASTTSSFSSSSLSTKSVSDSGPAKPTISSRPTYVYKAVVPTLIQPELKKFVNAFELHNASSPSRNTTSTSDSGISMEKDEDLSKKIIGSSVVTSVSVILNGNQTEFTDALGQKVPKPQPSLQVASPIDLLNPDRYEFYTFDENGELVKRLMTMEEIQSIVANGDGEGPKIIHHGPIEDRDPEKNVQDIVNSVQSVLNEKVESNKNASMENLPVFDTPDVSSTWSMILPAIFGNAGSANVFSHQKPLQIVMTPESEIIETSTKKVLPTTSKKSKPSKRKPGQKRKSTTTTTEITPQVIQEELDSKESVYTGMQQYHNLAASMQNYDGFSQLHVQPIYHKLPEIEASTHRVFINNQEIVKKPITGQKNEEFPVTEALAKKPVSFQHKPLPPHRVKKPNGNHTPTKRPQSIKQKIKRKPTVATLVPISTTIPTPSKSHLPTATAIAVPDITTAAIPEASTITAESIVTVEPTTPTTTVVVTTIPLSTPSTLPPTSSTISTKPLKRRKKPTRNQVNSTTITLQLSTHKPHSTPEKRKPSSHSNRRRPNPKPQNVTPATDLYPEGTAHEEVSKNKFQYISRDKIRPKPNHNTTSSSSSMTVPSTKVALSPNSTTINPIDASIETQGFSGIRKTVYGYEVSFLPTKSSAIKHDDTANSNIATTSGTSGYPVPSNDMFTDKPEKLDFPQYHKHPLASQNLIRNESKPFQSDVNTLQSFGQIMQTLKHPAQLTASLNLNFGHPSEKISSDMLKPSSTLKPLHYPLEDGTKSSTFKDFETTSNFPYLETASIKDENSETDYKITVQPNNNFSTGLPEDITINTPITKETDYNTDTTAFYGLVQSSNVTKESLIFTEFPENQTEQNTEDHTQKSEALTITTPINFTEPLTTEIGNQASTVAEGLTDQLSIGTQLPDSFLHKEVFVTDNIKHLSSPILVANLKPQLNMEVIKPSEQINMSDFQTQAATVASTLIDGANTLPSDDSNKTDNEIALLLSDVIHQISNNNEDSKKQVTNFNVNRFSNQAQLDVSFIMSPSKDESQFITSTDYSYSDDQNSNQPTYKPIYERFENQPDQHLDIEYQNTDFNSYVGTTKIPERTTFKEIQSQEFYTESNDKFTEEYTTERDQTESVNELNEEYPYENFDGSTTPVYISENDIETETDNNVLERNPTTTSEPISITFNSYYQHQKLEDDSEADILKDTTTLFNGVFEETTTQSLSTVGETSSETETNKTYNITLIAPIETRKSESVDRENATSVVETVEDSGWSTTENTLSTENYQSRTDVAEAESIRIPNNRIAENSNRREETTVQSITPKGSEVETTVQKNDGKKYNSIIMSEEKSVEPNAMIAKVDKTVESLDEDPYVKLGETTTIKSSILTPAIQQDIAMVAVARPNPVKTMHGTSIPTETQSSLLIENHKELYEDSDQEDEEDQIGHYLSKQSNPISTTTFTDATKEATTTAKSKVTTTRRLNTLKPVSYFNKQPAYALHPEPIEPLYNKHPSQSSSAQRKENMPPKVSAFPIPSSQQRPMQRPPQLSNLMISSTQSTRPPVKLEPSPPDSKGLEASLANLDEDILIFSSLCNELAFSYWKSITSEKISSARSLVISPFALTSMLSMVFLGARGSTSGEMNDVLKLDDMVTFNPHLVFKNITDSVEKSIDKEIATTAFVREIYTDRANGKVLQFFKEKTQQLYAGHVEEVNFHVVNDIIRRRTNLLVKRHTMGKVLEYLRTNSVWVNGPLATIAANLFQTDCSHGSTQDRDGEIFFQVHPTVRQRRLVPVPAVLFKSGFTAGYEPNLDATVVAFGRVQDTTSMICVMPGHLSSISPSDNLDRLEKQLMETAISENAWSNLLTSLMDRPGIEVQIPRFSHRSFVNATTGLQKMGLKRLFKSDYADLGGLTGSSNRDIYLSDMIQINTFSTCGEEKIADHHHVELYPAPPLRKRNKDVDNYTEDELDSSEIVIDFGSIVQDPVLGRGFYDDLLDPKYLELPLPLRPRQARVPEAPRIRFDKPFLYFVRHNPTGMIIFMGRFNPRLLP